MREYVEGYLVVHRRTSTDVSALAAWPVFGRHGGNGHQPTGSLFDFSRSRIGLHIVEQKLSGPLQHGIVAGQEIFVARIEIMLPDMGRQPGTASREHAPRCAVHGTGNAPEVGIVVSHPTLAAVHLFGCFGARLAQVFHHREQRFLRLSEVAHKCRPVVHLGIDVDRVFRVPRSVHLVVPYTLQIGGLPAGLRRRDQQIATVLHHQRHHIEVSAVEGAQAFVGGQAASTGFTSSATQCQLYAIVLLLVFLDMVDQKLFIWLAL